MTIIIFSEQVLKKFQKVSKSFKKFQKSFKKAVKNNIYNLYMKKYFCDCCNYDAKVKSSFDKHFKTKKHRDNEKCYPMLSKCYPSVIQSYPNVIQDITNPNKKYNQCKYCGKQYKYRSGLSKHIKYTCQKNKDEDFKELARLLNENQKQIVGMKDKQIEAMEKQIDKLVNKLQIQNVNNGNVNHGTIINNTMNIQLLNHNDTDYSHLTPTDYITCIKDCNHCVKTLIEKVHFNAEKPENMNIYLSNIKGKYLMIYKDNKWQIQDKKAQIEDLYTYNEFLLENWYDEYTKKYPSIVESFKTYLKNRDSNTMLNNIKEEILVMLYNKRNMISIEQT